MNFTLFCAADSVELLDSGAAILNEQADNCNIIKNLLMECKLLLLKLCACQCTAGEDSKTHDNVLLFNKQAQLSVHYNNGSSVI